MSITIEEIERRFPLHWMVWNNQVDELQAALKKEKYTTEELELKDPQGRTPLLLAVTLGHVEAVQVLIDAGADVNCEKDGWTAVQEATARGGRRLLALVLARRDAGRAAARRSALPTLLQRLSLVPDFYVEMKWEFTSWVPLVSRMCPWDRYRVYKRGSSVRVDTSLLGFDEQRWHRAHRTYIFTSHGESVRLVELEHEAGRAHISQVGGAGPGPALRPPGARALAARLSSPLALTYVDTEHVSFERARAGLWGWRQDRVDTVNGYQCKVYSAGNVQLVSKTRREHLSGRRAEAEPRAPLLALAGELAPRDTAPARASPRPESEDSESDDEPDEAEIGAGDVCPLTYFAGGTLEKDVGRPRALATRLQRFNATLWLAEDYPLQLQEQVLPILDLMAAMASPHFARLKDFVQMQLPAGFPVKVEIPLYGVVAARVSFENIFGSGSEVPHVCTITEPGPPPRLTCLIDDAAFAIPPGYTEGGVDGAWVGDYDDDERLLQFAIQQSLMQPGTDNDQVDVWEALRGDPPRTPSPRPESPSPLSRSPHDAQLQRAIEESLRGLPPPLLAADDEDVELAAALAASAREAEQAARAERDECEELTRALQLSLLQR